MTWIDVALLAILFGWVVVRFVLDVLWLRRLSSGDRSNE
jgi:hypothetical protein